MCGVPGKDGPACPVVVSDGGGHREGADVGDLDGQIGDPGGGPDHSGAPFLAEVFEALAPFGVPWYAADPAVRGICGDDHACDQIYRADVKLAQHCALGLCTGGYERSRPGMTMATTQPHDAYGHDTEGAAA
jgi:hypothetical protein